MSAGRNTITTKELEDELASWKSRVDDIIKHFDGLHCEEREKVTGEVNELYMLSTELEDRINELRS
jgi:hypothetical protein